MFQMARRHLLQRPLGGLATAALAVVSAPAFAQQPGFYHGPHMWGGWGWFLGPLTMVLFLALVVTLVVLLARWFGGNGDGGRSSRTALDILKERYARGEIDKDEFDDRRRTLTG